MCIHNANKRKQPGRKGVKNRGTVVWSAWEERQDAPSDRK